MKNYWILIKTHGLIFDTQEEMTQHLLKKDFGYDTEHTLYKNHNRLYLTHNGQRIVRLKSPIFTQRQFNLTGEYVHASFKDSQFALAKWKFPTKQTNAHFAMKELYEKLLETLAHNASIFEEFKNQI